MAAAWRSGSGRWRRGFYRTEDQRAEVDAIASLLNVTGVGNVYNYGDTKDWSQEYDILVMVGDPAAVGSGQARGAILDAETSSD